MTRPPNDSPDNHCGDCCYFHAPGPPGPCLKHPKFTTDAASGPCWDFAPIPVRHPLMCSDCARFLVHNNRLSCGAYPGAEVPAYLITCPLFTPKTTTPQPPGD